MSANETDWIILHIHPVKSNKSIYLLEDKVNTDGSYLKETRKAGVGGIVRNE